jgi:hypothetical protein
MPTPSASTLTFALDRTTDFEMSPTNANMYLQHPPLGHVVGVSPFEVDLDNKRGSNWYPTKLI